MSTTIATTLYTLAELETAPTAEAGAFDRALLNRIERVLEGLDDILHDYLLDHFAETYGDALPGCRVGVDSYGRAEIYGAFPVPASVLAAYYDDADACPPAFVWVEGSADLEDRADFFTGEELRTIRAAVREAENTLSDWMAETRDELEQELSSRSYALDTDDGDAVYLADGTELPEDLARALSANADASAVRLMAAYL